MESQDFEYFEGTKTIQHEDGSTTYVTYNHEPYSEPLTPKEAVAVAGAVTVVVGGFIALPFVVSRLEEWSQYRAERRRIRKEKKLADLKTQSED